MNQQFPKTGPFAAAPGANASIGEPVRSPGDAMPGGSVPLTGVVCAPGSAAQAAMQAYLTRHAIEGAKWFAPGVLHGLDLAVRQGRIRHVVFAALPDLLEGIWEEEIAFDEWPADVRIDFVDGPGHDAIRATAASWRNWRHRHRRRQARAGLILSVLVLALSFALCILLMR